MSDLSEAVARLMDEHGLLGIAVIRRDGIPAVSEFRRSADEESFAAMMAAAWGASEAACAEWTTKPPQESVVAADGLAIAAGGLDDEVLVAVIAESASGALDALGACRAGIAAAIGG